MRPGPQEPGDKPLILPAQPAAPAPSPKPIERRINTGVVEVNGKFETRNYVPPKPAAHRPQVDPGPDSIAGDSAFGTLYSKGYPRESLPESLGDELLYMPAPKWDWGMAE